MQQPIGLGHGLADCRLARRPTIMLAHEPDLVGLCGRGPGPLPKHQFVSTVITTGQEVVVIDVRAEEGVVSIALPSPHSHGSVSKFIGHMQRSLQPFFPSGVGGFTARPGPFQVAVGVGGHVVGNALGVVGPAHFTSTLVEVKRQGVDKDPVTSLPEQAKRVVSGGQEVLGCWQSRLTVVGLQRGCSMLLLGLVGAAQFHGGLHKHCGRGHLKEACLVLAVYLEQLQVSILAPACLPPQSCRRGGLRPLPASCPRDRVAVAQVPARAGPGRHPAR